MLIELWLAATATAERGVGLTNPDGIEIVNESFKIWGGVVPDAHLSTPSDPVVCKVIRKTGTRFASRVCKIQSDWRQYQSDSQDALNKSQLPVNAQTGLRGPGF